ncbi:MAG: hypothetical protein Kow0074_09700 [Candidatus Zixiibacteriota bacterium]
MTKHSLQILSVTGDEGLAGRWREGVTPLGGTHTACDGMITALRRLPERPLDIVLLDPTASDLPIDTLLQKVRHRAPGADIVLALDSATQIDTTILERWGVTHLFSRDFAVGEWSARLSAVIADRERVSRCQWVGLSPSLRAASDLLLAAASSDATVLVDGESGTGKELAARAVHRNSKRADRPFLAVNCSAFTETILESELFGHEKGAFTDAFGRKKGVFEAAEGGTIFLDEIGETSPGVQARLLRVLEERQVRRVGATESIPVDFRVVAATNRDLNEAVGDGRFRRDLYFRLAVVQLTLPALRERRGDIPALLAHHFTGNASPGNRLLNRISEDALVRLIDYDWPGNIRELRNFVDRVNVYSPDRPIAADALSDVLTSGRPSMQLPVVTGRQADNVEREMIFAALSELKRDLDHIKRQVAHLTNAYTTASTTTPEQPFPSLRQTERDRIADALRYANGNRKEAAELLGIGERTLYRKIRKYGL